MPASAVSVAPLAGAWIEINSQWVRRLEKKVAPLAGAWIEIEEAYEEIVLNCVAPLAGAWIEIGTRRFLESG